MTVRGYLETSLSSDSQLRFALAPALTPQGWEASPSFFHGFATEPRALAQGLVTLADITATRYFQFRPTDLRDPILTAHGDRLRAEVFSADNGVYARFDVLGAGVDGGEIGFGTTNVDIGTSMRQALSAITKNDLLHLDVGASGLTASTPEVSATERPVAMPDRWVRALGNAAELHVTLTPRITLAAPAARAFIASLPPASATAKDAWLTPTPTGVRVAPRASPGSVFVAGLHRFSALKRLLTLVTGLTIYGPADGSVGSAAVEAEVPGGRMLISITDAVTRGYSGEGALLASLATANVTENAALVSALLAFDPKIDTERLAADADLSPADVRDALAVLATSGRVGWDVREATYFHRELPDDTERVEKDNPRLVRARRIREQPDGVRREGDTWVISSGTSRHVVRESADGHTCTCVWVARYGSSRGPCAHILAVLLNGDQ